MQWSGLCPEGASWENLAEMRMRFPNLDLEDKVLFQGEGDVTDPELAEEEDMGLENEEIGPIPFGRAKRNKRRPKWLNNYQDPKKLQ